jgi:hypothetical protein
VAGSSSSGEGDDVGGGLGRGLDQPAGEPLPRGAIPRMAGPGVYALFLRSIATLPELKAGPGGLLYIGLTQASLKERNHFAHADSRFSSPRRSLGALLKQQLGLQALPRGSGPSPTNLRNYRFKPEGETRLTDWMTAHLDYAFTVLDQAIRANEDRLIGQWQPPLNLTGWGNPQRRQLRVLRDFCRSEARHAADRQGAAAP